MTFIIWTVMIVSLLLGIASGLLYTSHPLFGTRFITYSGGKFWLLSFICLLALYLE